MDQNRRFAELEAKIARLEAAFQAIMLDDRWRRAIKRLADRQDTTNGRKGHQGTTKV